jgi:hypothetical protein
MFTYKPLVYIDFFAGKSKFEDRKGLLDPLDLDTTPRYMSYIPFWA